MSSSLVLRPPSLWGRGSCDFYTCMSQSTVSFSSSVSFVQKLCCLALNALSGRGWCWLSPSQCSGSPTIWDWEKKQKKKNKNIILPPPHLSSSLFSSQSPWQLRSIDQYIQTLHSRLFIYVRKDSKKKKKRSSVCEKYSCWSDFF